MGKEIADFDYSEVQLKGIFIKAGLNSQDIDRAIADYKRYRNSELSILDILDIRSLGVEALIEEMGKLKRGGEIVEEIMIKYFKYINYKKEIAKIYQKNKSWDKVITTAVYLDIKEAQEAFIDYIEEIYQIKIKDGKHLQKLTGIKEKTLEGLNKIIISSRYSKYFRALEKALNKGIKYKDLLQIKPHDYGLPKTWSGCLGSDQYSSILWALSFEFMINEPTSLMLLPDLRSIAQEIEAPYSVLMDCYKLTNR